MIYFKLYCIECKKKTYNSLNHMVWFLLSILMGVLLLLVFFGYFFPIIISTNDSVYFILTTALGLGFLIAGILFFVFAIEVINGNLHEDFPEFRKALLSPKTLIQAIIQAFFR